jgi:hypothetical protein
MASTHQANTFFCYHLIQSYYCQIQFNHIIVEKSGSSSCQNLKKTITHGKLIVLSPEKTPGKVGRKSKRSHTDAVWTPSTFSLLSKLTPKSNLSAASSKSLTSNGLFCNTVRTLHMDNICTTPTSQVKISSKVQKPVYSVNFCNSSETLAECLKYVSNPESVPKDQESQLRFLLDQYKTNDIQTAFCRLIGKVGGSATTAFHPLPFQKNQLIKCFLALIYNTKSMLVDTSKNAFK